jgi:DNA-directed RNA polymerase II subunit RPB3
MPYITNFKIKEDLLNFDLNNKSNEINISLANAIRRTIISDISTYTIDEKTVNFYTNNSILNNEFLGHRLALIPIISNLENINYEKLIISCNKSNDDENIQNVYVKDFICTNNETGEIIGNDTIFKYPNILFSKLKYNQQLMFESKLIKNNPEHGGSYFCPVSTCIYSFKIDEEQVKKATEKMTLEEKRSFNTLQNQRLYELNADGNPNVYQFAIESIGFYEPKYILLSGLKLLIERLNNLKLEFRNKKSKKVILAEDDENPDFFYFLIDNENETLGNLLSTYITYDKNVFYCGYVIEHPLKKNFLFKIKLKENNNLDNVLLIIEKNIDNINNILNSIEKEVEIKN